MATPVHRQPRGRPLAQDQAQKQEYLLQVARECFIERGFGESSLEGIAAASGISKMTIYRWFGSKTGLFREVMLHLADETVDQLHDPLNDPRPLDAVLNDLALALYDSQVKPASAALTRLMIAEAPRFPKVVREVQTLVVRRSLSIVENYFAELGRRGVLRVDDAFRMAHQFATLAIGSYRFLLIDSDSEAEEKERVRSAVRLFLNGCRVQPVSEMKNKKSVSNSVPATHKNAVVAKTPGRK